MDHRPPAESHERPRPDWVRAASGLELAGLAVFLLLNTSGILPWSFWIDAVGVWPVLVIAAGIRIAFEKTRVGWLVLLGPVLLLASLAWVAAHVEKDADPGPWAALAPRRLDGTRGLDIVADLVGARFTLVAADLPSTTLLEARPRAAGAGARIDAESADETARVRIRSRRGGPGFPFSDRRQPFELRVPADLPLHVHLRGVMARGGIDLSRGRLRSAETEGVFQALALDLPATNERVSLKLKGVFNAFALTVPEGTPVTVRGAGFPLNLAERGLAGAPGREGYEIDLQGAFSALSLGEKKPPAEAPPRAGDVRSQAEATPEPRQ